GHHRPVVRQQAHVAPAGIDHRLDGEGHAGPEFHARARLAVMQHLRVLVEDPADAVTAVFAHHRVAMAFGVPLDGMADVAEAHARPDHVDADQQALAGHVDQPAGLDGGFADQEHPRGVAVVAVLDDGDVDVDDVAVPELLVARNAVAHHMVDRGADRLRKAAIVERRGNRLLGVDDIVVADAVQLPGRHPWFHVFLNHFKDFGREPAGDAHLLYFFRGLDGDGHDASGAGVSGRDSGCTKGLWAQAAYGIKRALFKQTQYLNYSHASTQAAGCPGENGSSSGRRG